MARPKSEDRKQAILDAAVSVIGAQGLGAPTALIAKEAAVSNGSLFAYFPTKVDLLNVLYIALKTEMGRAALDGFDPEAEARVQFRRMWMGWLRWAADSNDKRRTLAHLTVSDEVDRQSREAAHKALAGIGDVIERSRATGPLRDAPFPLVMAMMSGVADATVEFMAAHPAAAEETCTTSFDAVWRMLA